MKLLNQKNTSYANHYIKEATQIAMKIMQDESAYTNAYIDLHNLKFEKLL